MAKRKPISKAMRQRVFEKFNGHCAYCGCELTIEKMQVDHLYSVYRSVEWDGKQADNSFENLMPACRQCNFYKGSMTLEWFRLQLKTLINRVRLPYVFRLAEKYKMVEEKQWDGKFYFERLKEWQDEQANNNHS